MSNTEHDKSSNFPELQYQQKPTAQSVSEPRAQEKKPIQPPTEITSKKAIKKSGVIVNSHDLHNFSQEVINFHGRYLQFLGKPQTNFFTVIHGLPGQGKSNFALQFAKYLADNHGRVLYISGEEGFNQTFEYKLKTNGAQSQSLDIADCRKLDDILKKIPRSAYRFIVVDSLNNMGIDPEGVRKLRQHFKDAGLIAIQQSTKAGHVRGSLEIVHDCDIEIQVTGGKAITKKNRFNRTGLVFDIFPQEGEDEKDEEII